VHGPTVTWVPDDCRHCPSITCEEKRIISFGVLSLYLSRACLGKIIVLNERSSRTAQKDMRFSHRKNRSVRVNLPGPVAKAGVATAVLRQGLAAVACAYCSIRARAAAGDLPAATVRPDAALDICRLACRKKTFPLTFSHFCPEPVLVK
jgi:hypothetical protein